MYLSNIFFGKSHSNKSANQHPPTFNYFVAKLNRENNIDELEEKARQYIQERYPEAEPGSNYCFSLSKCASANIPPTDLYFIRAMTFRSCIPPYMDSQLDEFRKSAESYVQQQLQCNNTDGLRM